MDKKQPFYYFRKAYTSIQKKKAMAKMNRMFSYHGTHDDVTIVHSKLYGEHMRKKRGSVKKARLNKAFQKSVDLNSAANERAKMIKDALDPFRHNFRDGSMWSRLVGLFKTRLRKNPVVDFAILKNFELYDKIDLGGRYHVDTRVSILRNAKPSIRVDLSSSCSSSLQKSEADSYLQTLIVVFLNTAPLKATTCSQKVMLPLKEETYYNEFLKRELPRWASQKQVVQLSIPARSKSALIVVKCEVCADGKPIEQVKLKGMKIVKVLDL